MKGLLLKDFYNTRRTGFFLMILPLLFALIVYASHTATEEFQIFIFVPVLISSFFSLALLMNSLVWDEQSNYPLYAFTTPVSRMTYLKSKYLFHALATLVYITTAFLGVMITSLMAGIFQISLLIEMLCLVAVSTIFVWMIGVCLIAFSIKYSAVKASGYVSVSFGLMGFLGIILEKVPDSVKQTVTSAGLPVVLGILLVILITAGVILFRKSSQWLAVKEF
ncbi:MAG: ABC-2 transporter permease [Oscillospiraceae bacterium]|nr:ABC-2 transporter permease [Oscillospiraceae bacterium]